MLENTELVNEKILKRVELNSQPTECLGECIHFYGCKSFNVFYDEFGRLTCDLYAILDGILESSPLAMHFTLNAHNSKSPSTTQNGITKLQVNPTTQKTVSSTSPIEIQTTKATSTTLEASTQPTTLAETTDVVEESIIVVKQVGEDWHCVSSSLKWISMDDKNTDCQQFLFVNGGALKLPSGHCTETSGPVVRFVISSSCDSFTYDNTTKQFQCTEDVNHCINFLDTADQVKEHCHPERQYNKYAV